MSSVSSMLANINVNRLDDSWLSCLDLDEHEFELMDATMFMPHGWNLERDYQTTLKVDCLV
jgi:hypothetical protein